MKNKLTDLESRSAARAKAEITEQAAPAPKVMPEEEWNFFGQRAPKPLAWQMNHWLNYEYARSSRSIVQAVLELRTRNLASRDIGTLPVQSKVPRFAAYLTKFYPEFPDQAWLKLSEDQRSRRDLEAIRNLAEDPFEEDVLKVHDSFVFSHHVATGEIWLYPGKASCEMFSVLEIDFRKGDKLIEKKFREFLRKRRRELNEKFENRFKPTRRQANVGQHNNFRTYQSWMKRLAALRLLQYHGAHNWSLAAVETSRILGEPLYSEDRTPWRRAREEAAGLLKRFEIVWESGYYPPFILRPEDYRETLVGPQLAVPLTRRKSKRFSIFSRQPKIIPTLQVERFLKEHFLGFKECQQLLLP